MGIVGINSHGGKERVGQTLEGQFDENWRRSSVVSGQEAADLPCKLKLIPRK
jgi:hypothetical protein